MPTITFEPTGVDAGWNFSLEGDAPSGVDKTPPGLGWAVKVNNEGTVRLATGGTLEKLPGRVWFSIGTATPDGREVYHEGKPPIWGVFKWHKEVNYDYGIGLPEAYFLRMHVSLSTYEALRSLVAARTFPTMTVTVGSDWNASFHSGEPEPSDKDAIKYGWEPDGSGLEWDNNKFPHLEIKWCRFHVDVGSPKSDEDDTLPDRGLMPPTRNDLDKILGSMMSFIRKLELLAVPLWIAVFLLAILVYRGWR